MNSYFFQLQVEVGEKRKKTNEANPPKKKKRENEVP